MIASRATPARLPGLPDQPQQGLGLRGLEPKEQGHRAPDEVGLRLSAPAGQPLQRAVLVLGQENLDASHQVCNLDKNIHTLHLVVNRTSPAGGAPSLGGLG